MSNILVSLSGGIDSTTTLAIASKLAKETNGKVGAISFNYGQRHIKELDCAKEICARMGVMNHYIMEMPSKHLKSALTNATAEIPKVSYDEIVGESPAYVPFRNGTMLALMAGYAVSEGYDIIMAGPHAEDAANWAYADCTLEFMGAMSAAIYVGTYNKVRLLTPLLFMSKAEIVDKGMLLDAPLELSWSCYLGGETHCGECPTCRARKEAFSTAGFLDPTIYAV